MCKFDRNKVYTTREISEVIMEDFPNRYQDIASCMRGLTRYENAVNAVPANKQMRNKVFTGLDAEAIYNNAAERHVRNSFTKRKAEPLTPIEAIAKKATKEEKKAEAAQAIVMDEADAMKTFVKDPEPKESELVKAYCKGFDTGAETVKADPDDFEAKRKKFYTDVHYFMKLCSTPEERTAMLYALAALYGFTNIQKEG